MDTTFDRINPKLERLAGTRFRKLSEIRYEVLLDGKKVGEVEHEQHSGGPRGRHRGPGARSSGYSVWIGYDLEGEQVARDYQRNWCAEKLVESSTVRQTNHMTTSSIYTRKVRGTGETLTIGLCAELDISNDGEPEYKYATVCEAHGTFVLSTTRQLAYDTRGSDFCDDCRAAQA